ncbi:MAG: hypothetical protein OXQ84_07765 [bacterium]|nr:hypothetical protein [bacterium]
MTAGSGDPGSTATRGNLDALRRATQADLAAVRGDIAGLRWIVGINIAISLVTLAAVLAMAFRA